MERVQRIYVHPLYQECLKKNKKAEKTRVFCKHNMEHFMDVARISCLLSIERGYQIAKEEIYAAALLHDIGKWEQYENGTPHEKASAKYAEIILGQAGFTKDESERVVGAILKHRKKSEGEEEDFLAEILYDADKLSRACYACEAKEQCNWSEEKKNQKIIW